MQRVTHDELIRFRATPMLRDAANRAAEERGMNLSEFLRSAVREKVGLS
jgi:uncharacterized protein (DUF1778 family)